MTIGPGKYDHLCTFVRESTEAEAVVLIVLGGKLGPGFSVQSDLGTLAGLPEMLEQLAKQLRKDAYG